MKQIVTSALLSTFLVTTAGADVSPILTVQDFYQTCNPSAQRTSEERFVQETLEMGMCMGIAYGISSIARVNCEVGIDSPISFKANLFNATLGAQSQAMWNFAQNNPDMWQEPIAILIAGLALNWPCR